jgi:hypothetical protein
VPEAAGRRTSACVSSCSSVDAWVLLSWLNMRSQMFMNPMMGRLLLPPSWHAPADASVEAPQRELSSFTYLSKGRQTRRPRLGGWRPGCSVSVQGKAVQRQDGLPADRGSHSQVVVGRIAGTRACAGGPGRAGRGGMEPSRAAA